MRSKELLDLAKDVQGEAQRLGFGLPVVPEQPLPVSLSGLYDALVSSLPLRSATRQLFIDGHYAEAVEEAYKCVNNTVKHKSGSSRDGQQLMHYVFDEDNPVLKLNDLKTTSKKDEQKGYKLIFAGCMTGIRNPRAHEHDLREESEAALELLAWANHLMRVTGKARRVRRRVRVQLQPDQ
ncbi:MAG: TIGR02391 family protein [Actinobacteria bacterium RBG_13_63_9]|nr:MAG: TIGR02391 family protein [Actinobacteria bacterium RBG_13_63_9]